MSVRMCSGVHLLHCVRRRSYKSAGEDQRLLGGHTVATGGCPVAGARGRVLIGTNPQIIQLIDVASILEGLQLLHFGYRP